MGIRDLFLGTVVLAGVTTLASGLFRPIGATRSALPPKQVVESEHSTVSKTDAAIRQQWGKKKLLPAARASELAIMRRLALALTGSIPSLQDIRRFEAKPAGHRIEEWLDELLQDRRCADYLAERFARAFVGTEDGPFVFFRRRRFLSWLSDAILADQPYDAIVRDMISDHGLWTDHPATNFVSVTFNSEAGKPDPERLAARVSRAFLGTRIDCAQCHDHPFEPWKQADFRALAAFFGAVRSDLRGIGDGESTYQPPDRKTKEPTKVVAKVPSLPEFCPETGTLRERLAAWVVEPRNPSFSRATTNRVWALLFGRPLVEPIDDLPIGGELPPALNLLAEDFSQHGYSLHRLIRNIVATEAFRLDSRDDEPTSSDPMDATWASFPMTRLRPEQVAGSLYQSSSIASLNGDAHWFFRLIAYTRRNDFVRRYGDTGEDEFSTRGGTIPQRLLLMNGDLVLESIKSDLVNACSQIASLAPDDRKAVEAAYLSVLTRRPSIEEADHFEKRLQGTTSQERKERLTDLYWTLLNTTEFSWNH